MKYLFLLVSICFFVLNINAQKIDIGLFQHLKTKRLFIEAPTGKYKVKSEGKTIYRLKNSRSLILYYKNGGINISSPKKDLGKHKSIEITARRYKFNKIHSKQKSRRNSELNIRLLSPKQKARTYQGNLKLYTNKKELEIVNQIALPDYLAGVVEAESGPSQVEEYYKNQATICRTYAYKTHKKHKKEGFNLCDGVHCQAYKGKSTGSPLIPKAVKTTKNLVIVDKNEQLIEAVFSANCGGQTNNSEDVWTSALPYLRSINDKFCTDQRQAFWTKKISLDKWKSFLKEKSIIAPNTLLADSFAFIQTKRLKYYTINKQNIKLTTLRYGLKLRSTFFSIKPEGTQLILSGKGYGHGVGMCQEGAMNMAKKGHKFDEIIKYYYKGVSIVPIRKLDIELPYK